MSPQIKDYIIYFLTGGIVTVIIVAFEENGSFLISGFATLMPVFTLVAYFFIGQSKGEEQRWEDTLGLFLSAL